MYLFENDIDPSTMRTSADNLRQLASQLDRLADVSNFPVDDVATILTMGVMDDVVSVMERQTAVIKDIPTRLHKRHE